MPQQAFATTPKHFTQTVSSTAAALTGVDRVYLDTNNLNVVWITVSGDIRYWMDGTSPTTTVGHVHGASSPPLQLTGKQRIMDFRMIGSGGSSVDVSVSLDNTARGGGLV